MFDNVFKDKNVLITGNSGFKGSWLSLWLRKLGANVFGYSNELPSKPSMFKELSIGSKIERHIDQGNIAVKESDVSQLFRYKPEFVFHLAAQPLVSRSYTDPLDTIYTNVMGTTVILEEIKKQEQKTVGVIITSDKCYDNLELERGYHENDILGGKDIYSGSKGAAELIFKSYYHSFLKNHNHGSLIATARAGNVIGGGDWGKDRIVPDAVTSWSLGNPLHIRSPRSTRPWQHVLEPLSGYLSLAQQLFNNPSLNGQSFNFGPDELNKKTVEELVHDLGVSWGFSNNEEGYVVDSNSDFHEAGLLQLDCSKSKEKLKWEPNLTYKEMVTFTTEWYKEFYGAYDTENMVLITEKQINRYENSAIKKQFAWAQ